MRPISVTDGWSALFDAFSIGRVIEPALFLEDLVLFTAYSPDGLLCEPLEPAGFMDWICVTVFAVLMPVLQYLVRMMKTIWSAA